MTLPTDPEAVPLARRFLREACCREHGAVVLDDAQLLVSELVTNAVEHGAPPITLRVTCTGSPTMQVRVSDGSLRPPEVQHRHPLDEGGRGLVLVDILSSDWGVEPAADGKVVWFLLGRDGPAAPTPP